MTGADPQRSASTEMEDWLLDHCDEEGGKSNPH